MHWNGQILEECFNIHIPTNPSTIASLAEFVPI